MKTRDEWTEVVLHEARGLIAHFDRSHEDWNDVERLAAVARGGAAAFLNGGFDTHDMLRLAVVMLHLIRELQLRADTRCEQ